MTGVSRRTVLLGGAGTVAALSLAAAPAARAEASPADHERVLANLTSAFAGDPDTNAQAVLAPKITAIQAAAATAFGALRTLEEARASGKLFTGLALGRNEANLASTLGNLAAIALATVTPGATWFGRLEVQERVVDAMGYLHEAYLADQSAGYYGNWYQWEIGMPQYAMRVLAMLRRVVAARSPGLNARYVSTFDGYLRNGRGGDVDLASRFHTGANLVDITANRILQGALLGDDPRIRKAVSDQLTAYANVDRSRLVNGVTDGFYADGSFLQHDSVAYTGSYGKIMLAKVMLTLKLVQHTPYLAGRDLSATVQDWIARSFAPVIFEGYLMEIVKGRGVSRTTTGYTDVVGVIEAATDLTRHRPAAEAAKLRSWAKQVTQSSPSRINPVSFASPATILAWSRLMADPSVVAANPFLRKHVTYNAMDRDVSTRAGYAFALARTSDRVSPYEYMSGENLLPWGQGAGAYQLYLAGENQDTVYGAAYYALTDPMALAGVTAPVERRRSVPDLYGTQWYDNPEAGFTSSSVAQNTYVYFPLSTGRWSAGTTLGSVGLAGLQLSSTVDWRDRRRLPSDFVAYQNSDAVKTYLMLDGRIVVLTAGVTDPQGRAVTTTVDARRSAPTAAVTLAGQTWGGASVRGPVAGQALRWLTWRDATRGSTVGYVFLDRRPVWASVEHRSANLRTVRLANPNTVVTGQVATIGYRHSGRSVEACAYVLVPNATPAALAAAQESVRVIVNSPRVQAVEDTVQRVTGVNTFTSGSAVAGRLRVLGAASILMKEHQDGIVELSVTEPTQRGSRVGLLLDIAGLTLLSADPGVSVNAGRDRTAVTVHTAGAHGRTFSARLRRR